MVDNMYGYDETSSQDDASHLPLGLISKFFAFAANALFLIFGGFILPDSLPIALLNPAWQLKFIGLMLPTGIYALLGFCLLHISFVLNPSNKLLSLRLGSLRKWAIAAAIGFLLLIPLQGFATWRTFQLNKQAEATQLGVIKKRFQPVKEAINKATSVQDLQARLEAANFQMSLEKRERSLSLAELKKALIFNIDRQTNESANKLTANKPNYFWVSGISFIRTTLVALGYALAFAAGAQAKGSSETLLEGFSHPLDWRPGLSRRRRRNPFPTKE